MTSRSQALTSSSDLYWQARRAAMTMDATQVIGIVAKGVFTSC